MELQTFDFEASLNSIGNFVQAVVSSSDEKKKTKLVETLKQFLEMAASKVVAKKRFKNSDLSVTDKKIKHDSGRMDIPNEIWTKIMNYLPSNSIFKNFRLVCKRFHGLTSGIKRLHAQIIDSNLSDVVLKIVKNSRAIIAIDLEILYQSLNLSYHNIQIESEHFIIEAINSCQKLRSLSIYSNCELKLDVIEILKSFGPQLEHLAFENLTTTCEVFVEIGKLKHLKSLSLRSLRVTNVPEIVREMMVGFIQNLIIHSTQLESIDFEFGSNDPEVTNLYNKLINEKKDILRKIGLRNTSKRQSNIKLFRSHCAAFETISQCTNLEELSGNLHANEIQNMQSKLKRLLTVQIQSSNDLVMFSKMNHINLKHIEIKIYSEGFTKFAQLQFPALRYLMVYLEDYTNYQISLKHEDLNTLIKNSPNLKALRFNGTPVVISTESRFKIFETKGIIIGTNDTHQDDLEMAEYFYTYRKDILHFEKYKTIKTLYWRQFSNF